jgi:hypothetical protein
MRSSQILAACGMASTDWRKVCTPKDQALDIRRKP